MHRTQFLRSAGTFNAKNQGLPIKFGYHAKLSAKKLSGNQLQEIIALSALDRAVLKKHTQSSLNIERRRCNSGSTHYDFNRHVKLYLTLKALDTMNQIEAPKVH